MDLTIIRVKRSLDEEPLEEICLASKRMKVDIASTLPFFVTLSSKDVSLESLLQGVVHKLRNTIPDHKKGIEKDTHKNLYKIKNTKKKGKNYEEYAECVTQKRYQVVNKIRGITSLDAETEKCLSNAEQLSIICNTTKENGDAIGANTLSGTGQLEGKDKRDDELALQAQAGQIEIEILDVDPTLPPAKNDAISETGSSRQFAYDIFVTRMPKGYSDDDLFIIPVDDSHLLESHQSDEEGEDSDDSNAEDNYRNDYPEMDESDEEKADQYNYDGDEFGAVGFDDAWTDSMTDDFERVTLSDDDQERHFMGKLVPENLGTLIDWNKFNKAFSKIDEVESSHSSLSDVTPYDITDELN